MAALELWLAADHPAARGHFPGNPIIPGAVLLSEALRAVGAALERDLSCSSVSSAKFASPSRPGDRVEIEFSVSGERVALVCSVAGRTVLKAELACNAGEEIPCNASGEIPCNAGEDIPCNAGEEVACNARATPD